VRLSNAQRELRRKQTAFFDFLCGQQSKYCDSVRTASTASGIGSIRLNIPGTSSKRLPYSCFVFSFNRVIPEAKSKIDEDVVHVEIDDFLIHVLFFLFSKF
jgi:hypothetical protein